MFNSKKIKELERRIEILEKKQEFGYGEGYSIDLPGIPREIFYPNRISLIDAIKLILKHSGLEITKERGTPDRIVLTKKPNSKRGEK